MEYALLPYWTIFRPTRMSLNPYCNGICSATSLVKNDKGEVDLS